MSAAEKELEVSIVMPCLNEAETLGACIKKASGFLEANNIYGEVVIADNGSTDASREIAAGLNARVIQVKEKGYGNAIMGGIEAARGKYIIMGDSDGSYNFSDLMPFVGKLREGYDLVMGNRFKGGIKPGAMPFLHKYIGNPVLTTIGRSFFRCSCGDFHCGLRGFSRKVVRRLNLQTTGMEFASEMVIKATLFDMRICEVPTTLSPDGRSRQPHLRSWRDGWRHLRFMLLYSPKWLFFYPGLIFMLLGLLVGFRLLLGPLTIGSIGFDVQTLLVAGTTIIIGYQAVLFALFSKVFAINEGLLPRGLGLTKFTRFINLELGLLLGAALIVAGLAGIIWTVKYWGQVSSFGQLNPRVSLRFMVPSVCAIVLGLQTVLGSFFLSVLSLHRKG